MKNFIRQFAEVLSRNHADLYGDLNPKVSTFADGDTTPSVKDGHLKVFKTANTGATAITDFDEAQEGQEITVIFTDALTTIADSGNFRLSIAFTSTADDVMKLVHAGGIWYEVSRSVN